MTEVTEVTLARAARVRLARRRVLMFWISLPVVALVLAASVILLSRAPTAQRALDAYDSGLYTQSQDVSTSLLSPNIVEPYLPYFNRGDAYAADQYYAPATDDFEKALELAPMQRKCDVRLNLALTWERFGDIYVANGFYQGAVLLYEASQAVLDAAGPECDPPEKQQQLNQSKDRVQEKIDQAESLRDAQPPKNGDGQPDGQEQQLQDLQDQQAEADQQKADEQAQDRGQEGGGYSVEKPW
ncbi:MAG: tetratricopeptide repeat protein [Salinibacterium sp.]|nr:tetratricopeptide repeat protein [Salinibacterium sp.]